MQLRLGTVRSKFTILVCVPVLMMFAVLPLLGRMLNHQLIDEVDDRVVDAQKSFQVELDDDVADLRLARDVMASDPDIHRVLSHHDRDGAHELASVFERIYPDIDILLVDREGNLLTDVGPSDAPQRLGEIPELVGLANRGSFDGIVRNGCASASSRAASSRALAAPAADSGFVVVCQPLDQKYLSNTAAKLGLELALLDASETDRPLARTKDFPAGAEQAAQRESTLLETGGKTWAIARFDPELPGSQRRLGVVTALNVSNLRSLVQKNLLLGLLALGLAAVVSIVIGARLALVMTRAIGRVTQALKKLEEHSYAHVEPVRTGDELEDLATGFNSMVDGLRERDKLRTTFGKYMTEAVLEHLMKGQVTLGGELLPVTILFTDIRSFTTISEKMDAQSLVALLNQYFSEMVGVIMQNDGVVDKYIGDAIMAVFGAPVPRPDDAPAMTV